jgi:hypothetical protein
VIRLYWYFISYLLRTALLTAPLILLFLLAFDKLGASYVALQAMLISLGGEVLPIALGIALFRGEMSWILSLPIKKRNLAITKFLVHLSTFLICLAFAIGISFLFSLAKFGLPETLKDFSKTYEQFFNSWTSSSPGETVYSWMEWLLTLTGFLSICFVNWPQAIGRATPASSDPRRTKRAFAALVGLLVLGYLLRSVVNNSLMIFAVIIFLFCVLFPWLTAKSYGVASPQLRRWITIGASIGVLQVAVICKIAIGDLHSNVPNSVAQAVTFMGPFAGAISESDVAHLLEQDIEPETIEKLGTLYRDRFFGGKKVSSERPHSLDLARALATKTNLDQVAQIEACFDLTKFTLPEIRLFLGKLTKVRMGEDVDYYVYNFLNQAFQFDEIAPLLESKDDETVFFALVYARFHRDPRYIPAILSTLPRYPYYLQMASQFTLSLLSGRHILPRELDSLASGKLKPIFSAVDCAKYTLPPVKDLATQDALLNICIRVRGLSLSGGVQQSIDNHGWITPPLSHRVKDHLKQVLHLKEID